MNKVCLIGRLCKDPELQFIKDSGTAVAKITLAVNRRFTKDNKKEADFIPIVIWGKQAEATANYMAKGKLMGVSGWIQVRNYEAKEGSKRYVTEVIADEVQFLDYDNKNATGGTSAPRAGYTEDLILIDDDGEIPF